MRGVAETVVMWFRRDLRIGDHPALGAAARAGRVLPLFVVDPVLTRGAGAPRRAYLHDLLQCLHEATDGHLVVRHGDPVDVVPEVARQAGATTVAVTRDHGPYGRRRDAAVAERLTADDRRLRGQGSCYVHEPGTVRKPDDTPYAVFTPFSKVWFRQLAEGGPALAGTPTDRDGRLEGLDIEWAGLAGEPLPERPDPGCELPAAGEQAALTRWHAFLDDPDDGVIGYHGRRDDPAGDATSHLSPHLKWGTIHPRRLLIDLIDRDLLASEGPRTFASELAWRDFYADVLFGRPETAWSNLRRELDDIRLDTDAAAQERFEAWQQGRTGFPIVDAGMRQLLGTGWMHNRVRMITASFLVKDLHLPWQWGARHFMEHLVDGDLASNNHGWQWAAGTGTDAAPYFRVFNPTTQFERFDPDTRYVRRWVPEYGTDEYPDPMVDHGVERAEALARLAEVNRAR